MSTLLAADQPSLVRHDTPVRKFWFDEELEPRRTLAEERLHRQQRLAGAFRLFAQDGLAQGLAGHITARDPEWTDHFWVNPLGRHFGRMRVSDLLLVNRHGEIVVGDGPVNQAAFAIHAAIHEARPDLTPRPIPHDMADLTHQQVGRANGARHAFDSLYEGLIENERELLD
ncbi:hypothetical protein F0160_10240 [Paraburkholderia sp. JPY303]|uniref:class II aldolase/adducin family protein n=1 Tax=Paraburkholderia atlantica TaxID=2654982 RepID=UPI001591A223|nr:class II aldolase/adducin family protein [Paraburkholderia atlantica]NUY30881.1 hypothetical protein [Paraburkholderia atlantica]